MDDGPPSRKGLRGDQRLGFHLQDDWFLLGKVGAARGHLQRGEFLYGAWVLDAREPRALSTGNAREAASPLDEWPQADRLVTARAQQKAGRGLRAHRDALRRTLSRDVRPLLSARLGPLGPRCRGAGDWSAALAGYQLSGRAAS